jgi:hypothetical protein
MSVMRRTVRHSTPWGVVPAATAQEGRFHQDTTAAMTHLKPSFVAHTCHESWLHFAVLAASPSGGDGLGPPAAR